MQVVPITIQIVQKPNICEAIILFVKWVDMKLDYVIILLGNGAKTKYQPGTEQFIRDV